MINESILGSGFLLGLERCLVGFIKHRELFCSILRYCIILLIVFKLLNNRLAALCKAFGFSVSFAGLFNGLQLGPARQSARRAAWGTKQKTGRA